MWKVLVIGIILLFIGVSVVPNIAEKNSEKKNNILFLKETSTVNVTINDTIGDVCQIDAVTGEVYVITNSTEIQVNNLDIVQTAYTQQGIQATLNVQVIGLIEDRGGFIDTYNETNEINTVEYGFQLTTSEEDYMIRYCNQTGQLSYDTVVMNLTSSNFSVMDDTLSIWFSLVSADEIYENLSGTSTFIKWNFYNLDPEDLVYISDIAPNPTLEINDVYAPNTGYVGDIIQFHASVQTLTGLPPYVYHWDFGDQGTSTILNPTHVYTKPGIYQYIFTVTDNAMATARKTGYITITNEGELLIAFLFGRYANNITDGENITFAAVNLRMITFRPPQFRHFITGEKITVSNQFLAIRTKQFLIGLFNIVSVSEPPQTPYIACTTDSTFNRVIIASADAFVQWKNIEIRTTNNATWQVFSAQGSALDLPNHTDGIITDVNAGDYIQITGTTGNVVVTLMYIPTNSLLGAWTVNV